MSKENRNLLIILVVVIAVMVGGFMLASRNSTPKPAAGNNLVRDNSHKIGSGKVTVVEFGDYQCPACGQAYPITKQLLQEEDGKMTLVFRNFPLQQHQNAQIAAEAAEAANAQGKFWEMHDKLYATQTQWENSTAPLDVFAGFAKDLGLDVNRFKSDVTANKFADFIKQDQDDGTALNISGTPTFYVDGVQQQSFDHDSLKRAIEAAAGK